MAFPGYEGTIGGPDVMKHCHFPFEYKGVEHNSCIMEDSPGTPWCATDKTFSMFRWGYCDCRFGNVYYDFFVFKVTDLIC